MKSKPILIAIAAFAVTATGVQAFSGSRLYEEAGLSQEQISAFEAAREKRAAGDFEGARDLLIEAGVDEAVLHSVKKVVHQHRFAIHDAVLAKDYKAFKKAIAGTPLAEVIDSEEEFNEFVKAHELRAEGKWNEAREIFDELGVNPPTHHFGNGHYRGMRMGEQFRELTDEQKEALFVAKKANDREAVNAILDEAGIDMPGKRFGHW